MTKGLNPDTPMKDSGVEWLGEIPEGWRVTKFSYEIEFLEGPGILAVDFTSFGVPLIRIQNVKGEFVSDGYKQYLSESKVREKWSKFQVRKEDLIISCSASTGLVAEVTDQTAGGVPYTGLIILRPKSSQITKEFIKLLVQSDCFFEQIELLQNGATIKHFGPMHLQQIKIAVPEIEDQSKIADYVEIALGKLDDS